ncbi:molybdopterin molybdotransferase MoeA [Alkaliphilus peptidifermentans]|uniref:Molybdopterin molybdenumtransferase n=1 Tax=Alkaliphilus peptidifermentans DSM 18978 TaxID=1120976 RepID=A0A1G5CMX6_9FIRM|nr:gephyrin-like molybdotransferase Glp [Alkaliphilus peptidifermentans]SCY03694.1 molybdopterin molybdochelatase [Alkaliphilus peptidifermentans DSM 18978]
MELFNTLSIEEAKEKIENVFKNSSLEIEEVTLMEAADRVLADDIISPINVPEFNRSTVDGYAVIAKETVGASEGLPGFLNIIGEVEMGKSAIKSIRSGECCYVPTGGMLPEGSDGVVMVEYTELLDDKTICIQKPVAPLENCLRKGDDIKAGDRVLTKGHLLRSQDIGILAGMGFSKVKVYQKLRIGIISTGDEIVGPEDNLKLGQVRDMNTYSLAAAAIKDGCQISARAVVQDQLELLTQKIKELLEISDIILISGGSSMGTRDITKDAINQLGQPGVFIHGLAVKPGKPTIVGKIGETPVFGLPGQPVSALVIYHILVSNFIRNLQQVSIKQTYIVGELAVNIPSAAGKEHYIMVDISQEKEKNVVYPIHGKSGMLTMMTKSKGYIKIEKNQEGLHKGESVKVYIF